MRRQVFSLAAGLMVLLVAGACARVERHRTFGQPIDPRTPKITMAELVAKPEAYEGRNVVVEGRYDGACGDGDFYFKDKLDMIEADPPQPEVTALAKGTPIRLYGLVKVRRKEAGSEAGEKTDKKAEAEVRIAGKGVEVL